MTKESTEAAFRKAFSNYTLLNLTPEEEASIREYYGLDKPTGVGFASEHATPKVSANANKRIGKGFTQR